jgi:uncharacterized membrane protein
MDDALPPPRRRSRLLIVSLCVNVALLAFITLVLWRAAHVDHSIGGGPSPLAPKAVIAEFPGRTEAIQAVIAAHTQKIFALRAASAQSRREAGRVLEAPDYSPATMRKALAAIAAADAALEVESVAMSADSLATLTPAERRTLVEHLKRRNRSWLYRTFHQGGRM